MSLYELMRKMTFREFRKPAQTRDSEASTVRVPGCKSRLHLPVVLLGRRSYYLSTSLLYLNANNHICFIKLVWGLNELIQVKYLNLTKCLTNAAFNLLRSRVRSQMEAPLTPVRALKSTHSDPWWAYYRTEEDWEQLGFKNSISLILAKLSGWGSSWQMRLFLHNNNSSTWLYLICSSCLWVESFRTS